VELAREAARLTREGDAAVLDTLAAAYAEAGEYKDAVSVITRAIQLAGSAQNNDLAAQLESRRQIYLRAEPYRDRG
jgi:Flp pilus assembly protein TadD